MLNLKKMVQDLMKEQHFDAIAVGVIDFRSKTFECFEFLANVESKEPYLYFDLASLTKPLTNSAVYLKHSDKFTNDMLLLLNHKAGLTSGGLLDKYHWREFINHYSITKSETLYSDYSSLRCMLEIEKTFNKSLYDLCSYFYDNELLHWKMLPIESFTPEYGMRNNKIIFKEVHDNNAYNINEFVSHAGLFATINGLCKSLINLENETNLQKFLINFKLEDRFTYGFDRVLNTTDTLAGIGCSPNTFGHLGFTGTSFFIDCDKMRGSVILTNATQTYWYDRTGLNTLRKKIGEYIWKM